MESFDIAVIGAGMAGASIAACLAPDRHVILLEREDRPGYHSTGRSAALWVPKYGPPLVRTLTRASKPFFEAPGDGFGPVPLLTPRGGLVLAREDQRPALAALIGESGGALRPVGASGARAAVPLLRPDYAADAAFDPEVADIDVAALHQGFLRRLRAHGGALRTRAEVRGLYPAGGGWRIETEAGPVAADIVVNAGGAWADRVADLAGAVPLGLVPKRRTAIILDPPPGVDPAPWPVVDDVGEAFYLKPDAGRLLASPADATPSPPCDTAPDELDVAICVDRIERAFDLGVRHIGHRWAGLRSFLPDGLPVAGFDPAVPGFFWLAGQGGYGIQMAPALARAAAALLLGRPLPDDLAAAGVTAAALSPGRLAVPA
jgi:D-arginine dehydrogenase